MLAEPDGTFLPADVVKLLAYSGDCDAVFGTRTTRELIWGGANMGAFLKWGNWAVAKLVEVLFNTSHLSDVGCTYKLLSRPLAEQLWPRFTVGDSHFGPELMLRVITSGARFVEIPVNYLPRVGESAVTGDTRKAFVLGVQMIAFILRFRLATLGGNRGQDRQCAASTRSRPVPGTAPLPRNRRQLTATATPAISQTDFDVVAGIYDDVFPAHIREHYLRRRDRLHLAPRSGRDGARRRRRHRASGGTAAR